MSNELQELEIGDSSLVSSHSDNIRCAFTCAEVPTLYRVLGFDAVEELARPYRATVRLASTEPEAEPLDLVGKDVCVHLGRGQATRQLCGVVARVTVLDDAAVDGTCMLEAEIAPALTALALGLDTRIFQAQTAVQILQTVLSKALGAYGRELDAGLLSDNQFAVRELCVQYQESDLDFAQRLMEEEGIGYYFVHDERERVVLFHDSTRLPRVETLDGGPVRYDEALRATSGAEAIVELRPAAKMTAAKVTVRDHDWARGRPERQADAKSNSVRVEHESYQHGLGNHVSISEDHGVLSALAQTAQAALIASLPDTGFGLGGIVHDTAGVVLGDFTRDDVDYRARVRHELAVRDAEVTCGTGMVIAFTAGQRFELVGHHRPGLDGEYLLTRVEHSTAPADFELAADHRLAYSNRFECVPASKRFRPDRRTPKPRIRGVQTARVTGPIGTNIHTDAHGRIKVKFTWDRSADNPMGDDSCWLRVGQSWAGDGGPGFLFIPRVGMEVIVSFVDGDPDRPLVTGCVYNGSHPTPAILPFQATKSVIRTRSVPHGEGHNELSFEDASGGERIYVRAQRDLDELVLHDHQTHVQHNQLVAVANDQIVHVERRQDVVVEGARTDVTGGDERRTSRADFLHDVAGSSRKHVGGEYELRVEGGHYVTSVLDGQTLISSKRSMSLVQNDERHIVLTDEAEHRGILIESDRATIRLGPDRIELKVGASSIVITPDHIQVNDKMHPAPPTPPTNG